MSILPNYPRSPNKREFPIMRERRSGSFARLPRASLALPSRASLVRFSKLAHSITQRVAARWRLLAQEKEEMPGGTIP